MIQRIGRYINLRDDKLILGFDFSPIIVQAVRSIDGRTWNKTTKHWEIPVENLEETLKVLVPLGFTPHLDVKEYQKKIEAELKVFDDIKNSTDQPYTGNLPLYDFQRKGAAFLKNMPAALLGDVPGLGKTIQVLAATEEDSHVLFFTMNSLKFTTAEEITKWFPGMEKEVLVIDGDKRLREEQWTLWAKKKKYVIANYETLIHDFDFISLHGWETIVCDEATRISNPSAKTTLNLKKLKSKKRIAMTGTPISNTPDDLWSIVDWLVPKYLGTFYQFREKYCVVESDWGRVVGYKNLDLLKQKIDRFMLRRIKEEVLKDMPPKTIENIVFPLSESESKLYSAIRKQIVEEVSGLSNLDTRTLNIIPVKMLRLKQCTGHPELVHSLDVKEATKLQVLKEMIEGIVASGDKAIIFTQFAEMLHILSRELKDYNPILIYGDIDSEERMKSVKEFNDSPYRHVIVMTEAGAYGLNMQSASYVFHYDAPWSIAKLEQRENRAHRIGSKKPVTIYNLIAKGTIDEYVLKILKRKNQISVDILSDAERLGEAGLSPDDIKDILRL